MQPPPLPVRHSLSMAVGPPINACKRQTMPKRKPKMTKAKSLPPLEAVNTIRNANHGQVVLVLQGGGALGAYQGGVYQALHEQGIEPDWIIGTSIGAINAAIIAGNSGADRLDHLKEFWKRVERA